MDSHLYSATAARTTIHCSASSSSGEQTRGQAIARSARAALDGIVDKVLRHASCSATRSSSPAGSPPTIGWRGLPGGLPARSCLWTEGVPRYSPNPNCTTAERSTAEPVREVDGRAAQATAPTASSRAHRRTSHDARNRGADSASLAVPRRSGSSSTDPKEGPWPSRFLEGHFPGLPSPAGGGSGGARRVSTSPGSRASAMDGLRGMDDLQLQASACPATRLPEGAVMEKLHSRFSGRANRRSTVRRRVRRRSGSSGPLYPTKEFCAKWHASPFSCKIHRRCRRPRRTCERPSKPARPNAMVAGESD